MKTSRQRSPGTANQAGDVGDESNVNPIMTESEEQFVPNVHPPNDDETVFK